MSKHYFDNYPLSSSKVAPESIGTIHKRNIQEICDRYAAQEKPKIRVRDNNLIVKPHQNN